MNAKIAFCIALQAGSIELLLGFDMTEDADFVVEKERATGFVPLSSDLPSHFDGLRISNRSSALSASF